MADGTAPEIPESAFDIAKAWIAWRDSADANNPASYVAFHAGYMASLESLSARVTQAETEWGVTYTNFAGQEDVQRFHDRASCERFLTDLPTWADKRMYVGSKVVSRRAATVWQVVDSSPGTGNETPQPDRRAPVQSSAGRPRGSVAWWEHVKAWDGYQQKYKGQSAQRIAERGGFGYNELLTWLGHEPTTWTEGRIPLPLPAPVSGIADQKDRNA